MADRYFTLDEAQELVPWLEECFQAIMPLRLEVHQLNQDIKALRVRMRSNGGDTAEKQVEQRERDVRKATRSIGERLRAVQRRGVIVRAVESGLVDFPSKREGREVYLCWRAGESEVAFWHETDAGFAARQPL